MAQPREYDNYPCWIVIITHIVSLLTYLAGGYIMLKLGIVLRLGPALLVIYLLFALYLVLKVMKKSCTNCYYYGKFCAFGYGKLASHLFRKGNPKAFGARRITLKDILPDFLVSVVPIIAGIVMLIIRFDWLILVMVMLLFILMSAGNGYVRGTLACPRCRQKKNCPALKLFSKSKK